MRRHRDGALGRTRLYQRRLRVYDLGQVAVQFAAANQRSLSPQVCDYSPSWRMIRWSAARVMPHLSAA